jgi:hypothetical protein
LQYVGLNGGIFILEQSIVLFDSNRNLFLFLSTLLPLAELEPVEYVDENEDSLDDVDSLLSAAVSLLNKCDSLLNTCFILEEESVELRLILIVRKEEENVRKVILTLLIFAFNDLKGRMLCSQSSL